jgi:signal transduction histidine kinase
VRRRITVAMIVMVLVTLVLSGVVSLFVAQHSTNSQTRHELVREAQGLAASVQNEATTNRAEPARALKALLAALRTPLRLDGSAVLGLRPSNGAVFDPVTPLRAPALPKGLRLSDLHSGMLAEGNTVSGSVGGLVFAAYPFRAAFQLAGAARQVTLVIVLTRRPPSALGSAGVWLGLSAIVILAVAAVVASRLGRRLATPLHAAREVTGRIAAGDLEARVPAPPGTDPEFAALSDSINTMAKNLADAKGAERQFLQSVSHELRTPLTSIRGFAEAIEDGATADAVAAASVIATEARRLERLVADLLALATLDAKRFTLRMERVDLASAATATVEGFRPTASDLGVALEVAAPASPVWVSADPDRLAQVTANLVENALRFASSRVQVSVALVGDEPQLVVSDDGPGIAPEDLPRVFDRLFVSRNRPPRSGFDTGSGLGLAIVAELVAAMGGTVAAISGGIVVTLRPSLASPSLATAHGVDHRR